MGRKNHIKQTKKFQRSRLTFDLSAKGAHIGVPLKHRFSETIRPIEMNLYMKTPYEKLAKIYTKLFWSDGRYAHIFKNP